MSIFSIYIDKRFARFATRDLVKAALKSFKSYIAVLVLKKAVDLYKWGIIGLRVSEGWCDERGTSRVKIRNSTWPI